MFHQVNASFQIVICAFRYQIHPTAKIRSTDRGQSSLCSTWRLQISRTKKIIRSIDSLRALAIHLETFFNTCSALCVQYSSSSLLSSITSSQRSISIYFGRKYGNGQHVERWNRAGYRLSFHKRRCDWEGYKDSLTLQYYLQVTEILLRSTITKE